MFVQAHANKFLFNGLTLLCTPIHTIVNSWPHLENFCSRGVYRFPFVIGVYVISNTFATLLCSRLDYFVKDDSCGRTTN